MLTRANRILSSRRNTSRPAIPKKRLRMFDCFGVSNGCFFPNHALTSCCNSQVETRRSCRRLLLARLPRARREAEEQCGVLAQENLRQSGSRSACHEDAPPERLARSAHLGARAHAEERAPFAGAAASGFSDRVLSSTRRNRGELNAGGWLLVFGQDMISSRHDRPYRNPA